MPMVTANPQPRVMLVKPPWMVSPGFFVGNSTTIATTPVPNRMRTNVPRNSAMSSASRVGLVFMDAPQQRSSLSRGHELAPTAEVDSLPPAPLAGAGEVHARVDEGLIFS